LGATILPTTFQPDVLGHEEHRLDDHEPILATGQTAPQLSPREKLILRCLVEGDSNKSIAKKIDIAEATVKAHVKAILRKLRVPIQDETASVIETSYTTGSGSTENVRVAISTGEGNGSDDRWRLRIERTPNVIVGISGVLRLLNEQQFKSMFDQFRRQSVPVDAVDLRKITGRDQKEAFAGLFSEAELPAHADQLYFVFYSEGTTDAKVAVPAVALRPISTDLILFDRERRPFFATTLKLLAPNNAR
jgi:DNA-binding CsgD family transcriptional regulator